MACGDHNVEIKQRLVSHIASRINWSFKPCYRRVWLKLIFLPNLAILYYFSCMHPHHNKVNPSLIFIEAWEVSQNCLIGSLYNLVTWYGINYAGVQITQWDLKNKGKSGRTGTSSFCFVSATALHVFASPHNFFCTTWPDCAKGLLSTFHYYLQITGWTLVYNSSVR